MSSHSAVMLLRMMHAFHFGSADNYGGFFILTKARIFRYTYRASAKGGIYFRANSGKFCLLPEETFRLSAFAVQPGMSIRGAAVPAPYEIQTRRELEMRRAFTDEGWQI